MNCPNCETKLDPKYIPITSKNTDWLFCQNCKFSAPKNLLKINEMWAWVSVDEEGNEGVIGIKTPQFGLVPMVGADGARMRSLRSHAWQTAKNSGISVNLIKFTSREVIETISPDLASS